MKSNPTIPILLLFLVISCTRPSGEEAAVEGNTITVNLEVSDELKENFKTDGRLFLFALEQVREVGFDDGAGVRPVRRVGELHADA